MKVRSAVPRRTHLSRSARKGMPGTTDVLTAVFKNLAVGVIICDTGGHFVFFIDSCITNVLCETQRKRAVVHEGTQQRRTALE